MKSITSSCRRIGFFAVIITTAACAPPGADGGGSLQALSATGDAGTLIASERSPEDILLEARATESEPALTLDQRVGQAGIEEGLSRLASRCGRAAPLACASEAELLALGRAGRAARVTPSREHRAAIVGLAEASIGDFAIEFDALRGTPGRLDQVGFARRHSRPTRTARSSLGTPCSFLMEPR